MLKNIPTQKVRLGMYLQAMDGSWLAHPFWKTKFVLDDLADLKALLNSGVASVWINVHKGCDVADTRPALVAGALGPAQPVSNLPTTAAAVLAAEPPPVGSNASCADSHRALQPGR